MAACKRGESEHSTSSKTPLESIVGFLEKNRADLIVLSMEGCEGLPRLPRLSYSEAFASLGLRPHLFRATPVVSCLKNTER